MSDTSYANASAMVALNLANAAIERATSAIASAKEQNIQAATIRDRIDAIVNGMMIETRWVGTRLDVMGPDGWIEGPDLVGSRGYAGPRPAHVWAGSSISFQNPDGTMGDFVDIKGDPGDLSPAGQEATATAVAAAESAANSLLSTQGDVAATAADRTAVHADRVAADADAAITVAARDLTLGYRDTAQTLSNSVSANALVVQGYMTSAAASAASASAVSGLSNLSAAAKAIVTATDVTCVYIYDTTRDSDGGAWRDKCADQSWMTEALNTATRGATAKHPARTLIVGRNNAAAPITAYDLTDPTCPMWYKFVGGSSANWAQSGAPSAICALNGVVYFGSNVAFYTCDFILDKLTACTGSLYPYAGLVAQASAYIGYLAASGTGVANSTVNDVAATIVPLTPANPLRCGLPNPTVAVATAGGVSVIRADGVVCNSTNANVMTSVTFDKTGNLWTAWSGGALSICGPANYCSSSFNIAGITNFNGPVLFSNGAISGAAQTGDNKAVARGYLGTGVTQVKLDPTNPSNSLIATITDKDNTGWKIAGKTVLALAESSYALTALNGGTVADRSGSGNNPTVVGTLTRSVVASGADLAGYSGFSASNYMEVPAGSFDPGGGDFTLFQGWIILTAQSNQNIVSRAYYTAGAYSGAYERLFATAGGILYFKSSTNGGATEDYVSYSGLPLNTPIFVVAARRGNNLELTVNRVRQINAMTNSAGSHTNANATIRWGLFQDGTYPAANAFFAAVRVMSAALMPDQIAAIYADEAPLFAANAKALLPSATVNSTAYDADTDQLAVATAAGTSLFRGLTRTGIVNVAGVNDAAKLSSDNHKVIAMSGGDLVIGSAAQVYGSLLATSGLREIAKRRPNITPHDPTFGIYRGVTTDATPTVVASTPILEGRAYRFRATVAAVMYGGTATEKAAYDVTGLATRDIGGNVVVTTTTTTLSEVTSTMDCIAQANTTAQTLEIKATGKASTRLAWCVELEFYDIGLMGAA